MTFQSLVWKSAPNSVLLIQTILKKLSLCVSFDIENRKKKKSQSQYLELHSLNTMKKPVFTRDLLFCVQSVTVMDTEKWLCHFFHCMFNMVCLYYVNIFCFGVLSFKTQNINMKYGKGWWIYFVEPIGDVNVSQPYSTWGGEDYMVLKNIESRSFQDQLEVQGLLHNNWSASWLISPEILLYGFKIF